MTRHEIDVAYRARSAAGRRAPRVRYQEDADFMWAHGIVHLYAAMALQLFAENSAKQELAWLHVALAFEAVE